MSLAPGTRLGPYEIVAFIGAGGMGEVYRAQDPRLGREVAIKVLPASFVSDPDRVRRFEQEARAAGMLNHPNVVAVYDIARHDGAFYVVQELLDGRTLRIALVAGPLAPGKAIDGALQIARGLGAAHERGIVHRDLKPDNIFVTRDGRWKILDFGLAKLTHAEEAPAGSAVATATMRTEAGAVLGTPGYMSPEQVRGLPADPRSDLFSFGAILYEMLSGRRAFGGASAADSMSAILKEDPPELASVAPDVPHAVERIIRRCLEKDPEARFRSAHDLVFSLEGLSETPRIPSKAVTPNRSSFRSGLLPWIALALVAAAFFAGRRFSGREAYSSPQLRFTRLTFRQGFVTNARFAPDEHMIVYDATWEGEPVRVFSTRRGGSDATVVSEPGTQLLDLSSRGELALLLRARFVGTSRWVGTLARAPLGSGAPREILRNGFEAAWLPDGSNMAAIRLLHDHWVGSRLDFPPGKALLESNGRIARLRPSRDGKLIAFIDHETMADAGTIAVVDLNGRKRSLTSKWGNLAGGLAWSPRGDEVWFTASRSSRDQSLWAVDLNGQERCVATLGGSWVLHDLSRDGRALLTLGRSRLAMIGTTPGGVRDLSWLDGSYGRDISSDGQLVLFEEFGDGVATQHVSFLRRQDGSAALRLGDGHAVALSSDGKWALLYRSQPTESLVLVPTGAGEERVLPRGAIAEYDMKTLLYAAAFFPGNKRVVFRAAESGKPRRLFLQDTEGGLPHAFGEDELLNPVVSPDGKRIAAVSHDETAVLVFSGDGRLERKVPLSEPSGVIAWCKDSRSVFLKTSVGLMARIDRLDLVTGRRELVRSIEPENSAGVLRAPMVNITPDGKSWVSTYMRSLNDLYLVEGL